MVKFRYGCVYLEQGRRLQGAGLPNGTGKRLGLAKLGAKYEARSDGLHEWAVCFPARNVRKISLEMCGQWGQRLT